MTSVRRSTRENLSSPAMTVTIALVTAFGGVVVPFIGWIAGVVLMWLSPVWTNATKCVATIVPPVGAAAGFVLLGSLLAGGAPAWSAVSSVALLLCGPALLCGVLLLVTGLRRR